MVQKLVLEKILEMSIVAILGLLMHGEEALVDPLLEVQGGLQRLQRRGPLHAAGLGDVLEIYQTLTVVLFNLSKQCDYPVPFTMRWTQNKEYGSNENVRFHTISKISAKTMSAFSRKTTKITVH
jgi:hypothetical protein